MRLRRTPRGWLGGGLNDGIAATNSRGIPMVLTVLRRSVGILLRQFAPAGPAAFIFRLTAREAELRAAAHPASSRFPLRYLMSIARQQLRRCRFFAAPSARARAALQLGQLFSMTQCAASLLRRYEERMFGEAGILASLPLITQTLAPLAEEGRTPLSYLKIAVQEAPNWAEAWYELGRQLEEEGEVDAALAAYRHCCLSWSYLDPERHPENMAFTAKSLFVKAWHAIGRLLEGKGDDYGALEAYASALIAQPDSQIVAVRYAELLVRHGAARQSFLYWNEAMSSRPYLIATPKIGRSLDELPSLIARDLRLLDLAKTSR